MKKEMSKSIGIIIAAVVVAAIVVAAIVIFVHKPSGTGNVVASPSTNLPKPPAAQAPSIVGEKLSDSPYANYAYLISSKTLSSEAQKALTGFKLTSSANSDGSITYTLTAINPEYKTQNYVVKPGQSLYFIERNLGDDAGGNERFPGDDMGVIVDSKGVIVEGPAQA